MPGQPAATTGCFVSLDEYAYFVAFNIISTESGQAIGSGNGVVQVKHPIRTKVDLDAITEWALNLTEDRSRLRGATVLITSMSLTAHPGME